MDVDWNGGARCHDVTCGVLVATVKGDIPSAGASSQQKIHEAFMCIMFLHVRVQD